jgi:hypothetical protein
MFNHPSVCVQPFSFDVSITYGLAACSFRWFIVLKALFAGLL